MSDVLHFDQVSVVRSGKKLVDTISWDVAEGERWVLLGPNGAGKTTLLNLASAHLHPTSGTVSILDETLGMVDVFELRPRIGLSTVAIADRIPREETVQDVVRTAAYGVVGRWKEEYDPLDDERARQLLWRLGVLPLAERTFGTLSEGERKRVQIARALMTDPELLLLDEPSAGLDLGGRESLLGSLTELVSAPSAPATILVTHHVEEIPLGFTHVLLLREGAVVSAGPLASTLTDANLSAAFGLRLHVSYDDGRWSARAHSLGAHAR